MYIFFTSQYKRRQIICMTCLILTSQDLNCFNYLNKKYFLWQPPLSPFPCPVFNHQSDGNKASKGFTTNHLFLSHHQLLFTLPKRKTLLTPFLLSPVETNEMQSCTIWVPFSWYFSLFLEENQFTAQTSQTESAKQTACHHRLKLIIFSPAVWSWMETKHFLAKSIHSLNVIVFMF